MRIGQFGVGDLVKELEEHAGELCSFEDGNVGVITEWHSDGWRVYFLDFKEVFWMSPKNLELISESR